MFMPLASLILTSLLAVSAIDDVPTFDTRPTCAGAAQEVSLTRSTETCEQSERQARGELVAQWRNFPRADKAECVATTRIGGFPSYVQVLVCLELARDARNTKFD